MRALIPLPVLLPLLGAGATLLVGRHPRLQRAVSLVVLSTSLVIAAVMLWQVDTNGPVAVEIGGWAPTIGISLVADRLSTLMLVVSCVVTLGVLIYAVGQGKGERDEDTPLSIFHPTYLVLTAGVSNAFLTGDLFNLYVGFEVLLIASYVLLTLGGTGPRVQAGVTYVIVSLLSSLVFLAGIALVYASTGTLNMAQIALRMEEIPEGTRTAIHLVLLVAFGIKAAIFPLSTWLPDSYPTAAAPITAVFAGLLTKVGIYAIIRTETVLFPGGQLSTLLMVGALLTMIVGILGALAQTDIKRILSFTLVSHIGFMIMGIGLATRYGMAGAVFYVGHHILIQTVLFLVAGLIEHHRGSTNINRLGGLSRMPVLALLFFIPAMNLAGLPPLSGFIGKVALIQAGVRADTPMAWALVAGAIVTSLLTMYAIAKVWGKAFWRPEDQAPTDIHAAESTGSIHSTALLVEQPPAPALPRTMVWSTAALLGATLTITVIGGPMYDFADRAAQDLLERTPYLQAVLPEALR
jgi:multicomponent Na+:H+ antiporter subunit D